MKSALLGAFTVVAFGAVASSDTTFPTITANYSNSQTIRVDQTSETGETYGKSVTHTYKIKVSHGSAKVVVSAGKCKTSTAVYSCALVRQSSVANYSSNPNVAQLYEDIEDSEVAFTLYDDDEIVVKGTAGPATTTSSHPFVYPVISNIGHVPRSTVAKSYSNTFTYEITVTYSGTSEGAAPAVQETWPLATPQSPSVGKYASGDAVVVNWSAVSGATGYRVERRTGTTGSWKSLSDKSYGTQAATRTDLSYVDRDVAYGTKYAYRVTAFNSRGYGAASEAAEISYEQTDAEILASWLKQDLVVSYVMDYPDGDKLAVLDERHYEEGDTYGADLPENPTCEGYAFAGWYTTSGVRVYATTEVREDVTELHAHWTKASTGEQPGSDASPTVERKKISFVCEKAHSLVYGEKLNFYTGEKFGTLPTLVLTDSMAQDYWKFKGWSYGSDGANTVGPNDIAREDETTLYAVLVDKNSDSGLGPFTELTLSVPVCEQSWYQALSSESVVESGTTVKIGSSGKITDYLSSQYDWKTSDGTPVTETTEVPSGATLVATPKTTADSVNTVTFQANGGQFSGGATAQRKMCVGSSYGAFPASPTYTGYSFAGWYDAASGGSQIEEDDAISVKTLYAQWSKASTYTFKVDWSSKSSAASAITATTLTPTVTVRDGKLPETVAVPTPTLLSASGDSATASSGKTFKGYYSSDGTCYYDGNGKATDAVKKSTSASTVSSLFGVWSSRATAKLQSATSLKLSAAPLMASSSEPTAAAAEASLAEEAETVEISFDARGGTCECAARDGTVGRCFGTLPVPVRPGCTFAGWYTAVEGGAAVEADDAVEGPLTLYARWTVTVTFDANGGSGVEASRDYVVGCPYGTLPVPVRANCAFAGWYYNRTSRESETNLVSVGDITLTAHWLGTCERDGLEWRYAVTDRDRVELVGFDPTGGVENWPCALSVPASVDGYPVTAVTRLDPQSLTVGSLVIPHGIREIASDVFERWKMLKSVTLPDGLDDSEFAQPRFLNCSSLRTVIVPAGVTRLAEKAFSRCWSLRQVVLGDDLERIGLRAFEGCPANLRLKFWGDPPQGLSNACLNASAAIRYPASRAAVWQTALDEAGLTGGQSFADGPAATVRIRFDPDGGALSVTNLPYTAGEPYAALPMPVRPGFVFRGWRTADDLMVDETSVVQVGASAMTAVWQRTETRPIVTHVVATTNRMDGVLVSWTDDGLADSFDVYRIASADLSEAELLTSQTAESYLDNTAAAGASYRYWIVARNSAGSLRSESVLGSVPFSLAVSPQNAAIGISRAEVSVQVTANGDWQASADGEGLHFVNAAGSGSGELAFYVDADTPALPASWIVSIRSPEGNGSVETVRVRRYGHSSRTDLNLRFAARGDASQDLFLSMSGSSDAATAFGETDSVCLSFGFTRDGAVETNGIVEVLHEVLNTRTGETVESCRTLWPIPRTSEILGSTAERLGILQFLQPGSYVYRCTLDGGGSLAESDESDNVREAAFSVTASEGLPVFRQADGTAWECEWVVTGKSVSVVSVWPDPTDELVIPATLSDMDVVSVGAGAFAGCELTNVTIGASVTNVGAWAFANIDGLENVVFENPETTFDLRAFEIQDWLAEETGASFTLASLTCSGVDQQVGWSTDSGELFERDLSIFEFPSWSGGDDVSVRLLSDSPAGTRPAVTLPSGETFNEPAEGGNVGIPVEATGAWLAYSDSLWLTVSGDGDAPGELTLSIAPNEESAPLVGHITFHAANASPVVLTVVQDACAVPANDDIAHAAELPGASGERSGTTFGATTEDGERNLCSDGSGLVLTSLETGTSTHTVWYDWTAPADGTSEFAVTADFAPVMGVEPIDGGDEVVVSKADGENKCKRWFSAQKGVRYLIGIGVRETWPTSLLTVNESVGGAFALSWTLKEEGLSPKRYEVGTADGFATISEALEKADSEYDSLRGVEIVVEDGIYGPITLPAGLANTTIRSRNGAARTVVDGGGKSSCFDCYGRSDSAVPATLIGFTLRNGYARGSRGGGGVSGGRAVNCILTNNTNASILCGGGAAYATLENCIVARNYSSGEGAGTYNCDLVGCTVVSNWTEVSFDPICGGVVGGTCTNCIVWGNWCENSIKFQWSTIVTNFARVASMSHCCTVPLPEDGTDNFSSDPLLSADDRFEPSVESPCIDAGDDFAVTETSDVFGRDRVANGRTDVGAVEIAHVTVTFDSSDGIGRDEEYLFAVGLPSALPETSFTKRGCALVGWSTDPKGELTYRVDEIPVFSVDTRLYAVWQAVRLSVSPQTMSLPADGGWGEIVIAVDTPWTLDTDANWLHFDVVSSSASTTAVFWVDSNPFPQVRSAVVTIRSGGVESSIDVTEEAYCGMPKLVVEDNVLKGWRGALSEQIAVPDGVTNIADRAFADCPYVKFVYVPNSVVRVGDSVFSGSAIEKIVFGGDAPAQNGNVFSGALEEIDLVAPESSNGWTYVAITDKGCECVSDWCGRSVRTEKMVALVCIRFCVDCGEYWCIIASTNLKAGSVLELPETSPQRDGYQFAGWWTHPTAGERVSSSSIAYGKTVGLYARWMSNDCVDPLPEIVSPTGDQLKDVFGQAEDANLVRKITSETSYAAFREWAGTVKPPGGGDTPTGEIGVMVSPHAWLSYALGSETLLEVAPTDGDLKVEVFKPTTDETKTGQFDFTVHVEGIEVGNGVSEAQKQSEAFKENLKQVFGLEGGSTLNGMEAANVDITFGAPQDGKVKFTAGPKDTDAKTFFMKIKVNP